MSQWIWCNGRLYPEEEVALSVRDRAVLHGASLFETLRCYRGYPFRLQEHLNRLHHWMSRLALFEYARTRLQIDSDTIHQAVLQLLQTNDLLNTDARLRITVTAGSAQVEPKCLLWAEPIPPEQINRWRLGIRATLLPTPFAWHEEMPKWGSYAWHAEAQLLAQAKGAEEAIWFTSEGYLTEGTYSNLFLWYEEQLLTPPLEEGILAGITRQLVLDIAQTEQIEYRVERIPVELLHKAHALFLTNAVREIVPVTHLDDTPLPTHPIVERLQEAYRRIVAQEISQTPPASS